MKEEVRGAGDSLGSGFLSGWDCSLPHSPGQLGCNHQSTHTSPWVFCTARWTTRNDFKAGCLGCLLTQEPSLAPHIPQSIITLWAESTGFSSPLKEAAAAFWFRTKTKKERHCGSGQSQARPDLFVSASPCPDAVVSTRDFPVGSREPEARATRCWWNVVQPPRQPR